MIYIKGGKIVDANGVRDDPAIIVDDNRITEVGSCKTLAVPKGADIIDASGLVLMPGMIDSHVHLWGSAKGDQQTFNERFEVRLIRSAVKECQQLLDVGFTSVMDGGSQVGFSVRNAINEGVIPGPRVMASRKPISITGGHGDSPNLPLNWVKEGGPFGWGMEERIADGPDECMRAVREQIREGADFIKILTSGGGGGVGDPHLIPEFSFNEIKVMVEEAHNWRRKIHAHCYNSEGIKRSVNAGVDAIIHANLADDESIQLMKMHNTIVVPTMSIFEAFKTKGLYEGQYQKVRRLYDSGITLAMGTDTYGGPVAFGKNALELELYVEKVGLTPLEAIKICTLNGSKAMGRDDLGVLEKGKVADLIALEKSPLDNIRCLQDANNTKLVVKEGRTFKNRI